MIRPLVPLSFLLALGLAAQTPPDFWATEKSPRPDLSAVMTRKAMGRDALMPTSGGVFAHIAHGGPWRTLLTLINPGTTETARAVLAVYTTSGAPLTLTLTNGRKVVSTSKFEIVLAPRAVMFLEPVGLPSDVQTGFAILETEAGSVTGYAVFRAVVPGRPDMEAVVPLDWSVNDNTWIAFDNTRGFVTSVAIANRWQYFPCELTADVFDEDGALLASYRRVLPGMSQQAFETFREWPATAGRRGVVRLTNANPVGGFAALALLFNPTGSVTTAPSPDVLLP
ncbi:MAG: hypothetical protein ACUVS7_02095 [Bryobacteraceae bacterium]